MKLSGKDEKTDAAGTVWPTPLKEQNQDHIAIREESRDIPRIEANNVVFCSKQGLIRLTITFYGIDTRTSRTACEVGRLRHEMMVEGG